jgi:hypothetical protein
MQKSDISLGEIAVDRNGSPATLVAGLPLMLALTL